MVGSSSSPWRSGRVVSIYICSTFVREIKRLFFFFSGVRKGHVEKGKSFEFVFYIEDLRERVWWGVLI